MEIEIKSPAVQEVLGRPPRWIIRWGITVIMIIIAGLLVGSYFFKYPDVVSATIEVTTENLPVSLVARATGKLDTIFVADNEIVEKEQYLAVIENPADFGDVLGLKGFLDSFNFFSTEEKAEGRKQKAESTKTVRPQDSKTVRGCVGSEQKRHLEDSSSRQSNESKGSGLLRSARNDGKESHVSHLTSQIPQSNSLVSHSLTLGDLQIFYHHFLKACEDYDYFVQADYHVQKINALRRQIALQQQLRQRTLKQCDLSRQQLATQERLFAADSILYAQRAIALIEYENARSALLQMQLAYQSVLSSVDNIELTIAQYEQTIFDLQQQSDEKKKELLISLSGAYEALQSQIAQWEMQYVLKSPSNGKVSMSRSWQKNQHINAGEVFLSIVPEETAHITGKILLPAQGAGKVKVGQSVNVKFDGYPHMEFGMVRGKVKNISLVPVATPQGKFTTVEVEFPENLTTNYGKTLDFSQEMSGTAEIITEDMRLIERFINPVKAVVKK